MVQAPFARTIDDAALEKEKKAVIRDGECARPASRCMPCLLITGVLAVVTQLLLLVAMH